MKHRSEQYVLAIDPGETCGWVFGKGQSVLRFGNESWKLFLIRLDRVLRDTLVDRVVIERFHTRVLTQDSELTLEIIGGIKAVCTLRGITYAMVNPSDKKKTMQEVRKNITNKHARDAEAIRLWDYKYGRNW